MAKSSSTPHFSLKKEIVGVVFVALATLLALSLLSFNPDDPSFNNRVSGPQKATNLAGFVGAHLADLFFQTFGLSAFLWPFFLVLFALKFFGVFKLPFPPPKIVSFLGLFITASSLLSLSLGKRNILGGIFDSGGALGHFVARVATRYLNFTGAMVFLTLVLVISVMVLTNLSVLDMSRAGGRRLLAGVDRAQKSWKSWKKRKKMEEAREAKKEKEPILSLNGTKGEEEKK